MRVEVLQQMLKLGFGDLVADRARLICDFDLVLAPYYSIIQDTRLRIFIPQSLESAIKTWC